MGHKSLPTFCFFTHYNSNNRERVWIYTQQERLLTPWPVELYAQIGMAYKFLGSRYYDDEINIYREERNGCKFVTAHWGIAIEGLLLYWQKLWAGKEKKNDSLDKTEGSFGLYSRTKRSVFQCVKMDVICPLLLSYSSHDMSYWIEECTIWSVTQYQSSSRVTNVGICPWSIKSILFSLTQQKTCSGSSSGFCAC